MRQVVQNYRDEFPWLEPSALEATLMLLWASSLLAVRGAPSLEEFGLSSARFNVLRLLHQAPNRRLPMNEIAAGLYVTATNVTKLVNGLEREGLVRRETGSADRRFVLVVLTEEAESRLQAMLPRYMEHTVNVWRGLSVEERQVLSHLLAKLRLSLLSRSGGTLLLEQAGVPS